MAIGNIGFYQVYLTNNRLKTKAEHMKLWDNIFRVVVLIMGTTVIIFNAQLFIYSKQQRVELSSIRDKQDAESEFNSNKFKYEQDQIERTNKDLEDTRQQVKDQKGALGDQKDSLLQEIEKRQQIENEVKGLQVSLVDLKAETDAIKQDMKGWQKDYVGVLAQLDKGVDNIQEQIKGLHENLNSLNIPGLNQKINSLQVEIEKVAHPAVDTSPDTSPVPNNKNNI